MWYDSAHSTITMIKLRSDLHSRTPHSSLLRASYGVSFASYTKKNDRDISRAHCTSMDFFYCTLYNEDHVATSSGAAASGDTGCPV